MCECVYLLRVCPPVYSQESAWAFAARLMQRLGIFKEISEFKFFRIR